MLKFDNVSLAFDEDQFGLKNISFEIEPGALVLVTGPSGAGKTSLIKLLTKEYDLSEGNITFEDADISTISSNQLPHHRRKIGVVYQNFRLLDDLTVWENLALALSIVETANQEFEERIEDLLKLVGLPTKADVFPGQLSGGEMQRISIARALAPAPKLLFADEPTGNLDAETSKIILKLLKKINELGTTVIVTTHDPVLIDGLSEAHLLQLKSGEIANDSRAKAKKTNKKSEAKASKATKEDEKSDHKKESPETNDEEKETKAHTRLIPWWKKIFGKKDKKTEESASDDVESTSKDANDTTENKKDDTSEEKPEKEISKKTKDDSSKKMSSKKNKDETSSSKKKTKENKDSDE